MFMHGVKSGTRDLAKSPAPDIQNDDLSCDRMASFHAIQQHLQQLLAGHRSLKALNPRRVFQRKHQQDKEQEQQGHLHQGAQQIQHHLGTGGLVYWTMHVPTGLVSGSSETQV
jgi:hypothetical protein